MAYTAIVNIKQRPAPIQIYIKFRTKRLITLVPITRYTMTTFNKKLGGMLKGKKKKHSEDIKQTLVPDSDMTQISGTIR